MISKNTRNYLFVVLFLTSLMFVSVGCESDDDDPVPTDGIGAPTDVRVSLSQASSFFATVTWGSSANESRSDFKHYVVNTYEVDSAGTIISMFNSENVGKTTHVKVVTLTQPLKRYRTYVRGELNDGTKSDSVSTPIYAAVYEGNGEIDKFDVANTLAESGFGWNTAFGVTGSQLGFTTANAANIDIHLRDDGGTLRMYSPNAYTPGIRTTSFIYLGRGESIYNRIPSEEPNVTSISVSDDDVILVKTQSNVYVKVWIQDITNNSATATFKWKVQPVAGLKALKR